MKLLAVFLVVYVSPGCLSQCVNCAPQPTYQYVLNVPSNYVQVPSTSNRSPCCVPTSNVQTIQSARAFTNGAQGSQVIMYYNGQRVVSGAQQPQQQQQGSNFNQANNYQNPGPIPGYSTGYDQNQNQNQTGYYPNNINGGVVAGGATTGTVVVGGVTQQGVQGVNAGGNVGGPNQNINAGGNIGNQYQNNDPYQNQQNVNAGGVVGNQNQYQNQNQNQGNQGQYQDQNQYQNQNINAGGYVDQNQNQFQTQDQSGGYIGDQNQNQGQYQDSNQGQYQGSTLSPSGGEVGYQPFVPSGNTDYNNGAQGQFDPSQQGQQGQQGQYQQNQNDQNVIYPAGVAGGAVAGGAVAGSSYNSPNSGYVNSQVQPQTYPTQTVTGGAINNQNVQQQPDVNTQYQDQMNQQNQQNMGGQQNQGQQNFQGNPQGNPQGQNQQNMGQQNAGQNNAGQQNFQGNQGAFVGSSTTPQGQQFTSTPNNQQGQQGFTNQPNQQNQQGGVYTGNQFTSTPGYQQGDFLTEGSGNEDEFLGGQQQFTSSPAQQQNFNDGQQGFTDNTLTPPVENVDNSQFTQAPSTVTPFPVIYPVGQNQQAPSTQQTQQPQQFQNQGQTQSQTQNQNQFQTQPAFQTSPGVPTTTQTPYPVIYPVPSAGQQTSTVSSNQDEFGVSSQFQNDAANFETTTQSPVFVPVPVPVQNNNNGNVPLESTTTVPIQNDSGSMPVTGSTASGQFIGGNQGQSSTNSFQSTTPTTTNFNNGQSSTGFQSTTGMPVTNDNSQSGFIASSTMDPNMPQAQYPSQQEILAATGQQADQSATSGNMVSTQAPQFPSQQELGATLQSTQPTPAPQFPAQQDLGATQSNNQNQNFNGQQGGFSSTQQPGGATAQFPSQQELLQRDQQNTGATGQPLNSAGFTPQYGDMNTQYGRYASSTASSNPQFDQPTADQQQPQNSAVSNFNIFFATLLMIFLW